MRKLFVLMILSLFLVSLISAAPPQFSTGEFGFDIRTGVADTLKQGQVYDLHVHIFNKSNGVPIYTGASCVLHLYNLDGTHIFEGTDTTPSHLFDYSWDLDGNNFTQIGSHPYIIQCNTSNQGGFYSGELSITKSGMAAPSGVLITFLMLLSIVTFLGLIWSLYKILEDFAKLEVTLNTIFIGFTFYIGNLAYYYFLTNFMAWDLMLDISLIGMSAFGVTHIFIPLVGLIFSWIKKGGVE